MAGPSYSVVIPTYNRRRLLAEAIDSVILQQWPALEIIVVDDGSDDGTAEMLARDYPDVRYFFQKNRGPAAAKNHGIAKARGDLVAFLDSDDLWLPGKLDIEAALLARFPDAALLAGNATSFVGGALRAQDTFAQRGIAFEGQAPRYFDWSLGIMKLGPVCCTSGMTFRKPALAAMGARPFDESLRLDEDWDLEFRFFSRFPALLYPQIVCQRRVYDDGTRLYYSPSGKAKSGEEQRRIWRQQHDILSRYLDVLPWDAETREGFRLRQHELDTLSQVVPSAASAE